MENTVHFVLPGEISQFCDRLHVRVEVLSNFNIWLSGK